MKLTIIIVAAFIVWFSSLWIAVLSVLSIVGGWKKLSGIFPLSPYNRTDTVVKYSMSSIKIGLINYNSCALVSFTESGIIIEMIKIFSVMHKPLFIPYERMSGARRGKVFFSMYTSFTVENKTIMIFGKPGDELCERLNL